MGRCIIIDHNKGNSFKMFFGKLTGDPFKNCCLSSPTSDWDTQTHVTLGHLFPGQTLLPLVTLDTCWTNRIFLKRWSERIV